MRIPPTANAFAVCIALFFVACPRAPSVAGDTGVADGSRGFDGASDIPDATALGDGEAGVYDPYNDPDARSPATAVNAPNETWTWVQFADAVCANGSSTGLAVNLTQRSSKVLIYVEGGGACWDAATCITTPAAWNLTGYNQANWDNPTAVDGMTAIAGLPFFRRTLASNPFKDFNYVFIPYCTGDLHAGMTIAPIGGQNLFFMGYRDLDVFLRRLVPTFANSAGVWLSGSSAGGFGALLNWEHTQTAFGTVHVDLIDDSGPPVATSRYPTWVSTWNMQLPTGCPNCPTDMSAIVRYYAQGIARDHRMALLSYDQDMTISAYFLLTQQMFHADLNNLLTADFDPNPNIKYFEIAGTTHTLLPSMPLISAPVKGDAGATLSLATWLNQMVTGDPAWTSVHSP